MEMEKRKDDVHIIVLYDDINKIVVNQNNY